MEKSNPFTCSLRFEEKDYLFLASVVAAEAQMDGFRSFVSDPRDLQPMLDDRRVLRALLESPVLLDVTPWFYFFVLTRHSLLHSGLDDLMLAEYLGAVLAERVPVCPHDALRGIPAGFVHTVDFLTILDQASGRTRYELLVTAGNQFLVLTGIFPDFIRKRSERHGAPGLEYYERFAQSSFHEARKHPQACRNGMGDVLRTLTDVLPEARRSLNRMADSLLFLAS